jgi:hypothetical protein
VGSRAAIEVGPVVGFAPAARYVHPDKPRRGAGSRARAVTPADLPLRDDILISAFAVAAFSVIVQGLTAPLALRALR